MKTMIESPALSARIADRYIAALPTTPAGFMAVQFYLRRNVGRVVYAGREGDGSSLYKLKSIIGGADVQILVHPNSQIEVASAMSHFSAQVRSKLADQLGPIGERILFGHVKELWGSRFHLVSIQERLGGLDLVFTAADVTIQATLWRRRVQLTHVSGLTFRAKELMRLMIARLEDAGIAFDEVSWGRVE